MSHVEEGRLHAYLDGELAAEQERRLEKHVEDCGRCESLLEGAIHARAAASRIVTDAETPEAVGWAPEWDELVRRAGEDEAGERSEATGGDPEDVPSLLVPGLAWAATLVLAFFLGWQSADRFPPVRARSSVPPAARSEPSLTAAEEAPTPGSPGPATEAEAPPLVENREEVAREMDQAARELAALDQPKAAVSEPLAADRISAEAPAGAPSEDARDDEAPTVPRRASLVGAPGPSGIPARMEGIPPAARQIPLAAAEAWLGAPARGLSGAVARTTAVGPASILPGAVPGRPVLVTVYDLDGRDATLTLIQQFVGAPGSEDLRMESLPAGAVTGEGQRSAAARLSPEGRRRREGSGDVAAGDWIPDVAELPPGGVEGAELVVRPDGTEGLRWLTPGGYLLLLEGPVTEAELRRLARTVE